MMEPTVTVTLNFFANKKKGGGKSHWGEGFLEACVEASLSLPEEEVGSLAAFPFLAQHFLVGSESVSDW
ncbi:hypothetical protein DSO57_1017389 [Entomophthora muscae]|uniref:Uncharacterized protein n=1 Tax=Entomophthora muscae TaxID=34485 RepID=A0ACC2STG2_9FUNG|nr:hypothetical protein DSO57_1017389 [Entomophthora muscae]